MPKKGGKILICNFERVFHEKLKTELALQFHPKNTSAVYECFSLISRELRHVFKK